MHRRKDLVLLVAIAGLAAILAVVGFGIVSGEDSGLGRVLARIWKSPDASDVVIRVDNTPIMRGAYLATLEDAKYSYDWMKSELGRPSCPAPSPPSTPSVAMPPTQQPGDCLSDIDKDVLSSQVMLLDEVGVDASALAKSIVDAALFAEATRRGLAVPLIEAAAQADERRQLLNAQGGSSPMFDELIKEFGEERYWSEIAPVQIQKAQSIGNLYESLTSDMNPQDTALFKCQLAVDSIRNAQIEIVDSSVLGHSSVDDALQLQSKVCENLRRLLGAGNSSTSR